jgi:dTDP-glucose pyrophosphorylase
VAVPRIAVVAAAGRGTRIHPRSATVPKVLLRVAGKPLLTRNFELLRDQLGIREVHVVIGYLGEQIRAEYGDGGSLGLDLRYLVNEDVEGGLGTALFVAERAGIDEPFVMLLGDELYLDSNHRALASALEEPWDAACAIYRTEDRDVIRRNYSVALADGRITALVEKPADAPTPYVGCGTYVFTPGIYDDARATPRSARSGRLELTDVIDRVAKRGIVRPFELTGHYLNVNTIEDLNTANYVARTLRFREARVSVIIPAYNEAASIGHVVRDFRPHAHEVVVMDNVSSDGSGEIARAEGALVYSRPLRGYGDALAQGLDAASGDILVLVEADATFRAKDLGKLLEYLKDADMVIGTRTTRQMIEQGANMDGLLRWGNVVVGKLVEALWWSREPRFTDVGCTYRALWRDSWQRIRGYVSRTDATFSPEMMIEMIRAGGRVVEIPVSYYGRRGGESKHSASRWHSARTGLKMLRLIAEKRLNLS